MRQPEDVEAEFGEDSEDVVADAGNNADLYAANQASTELINEAPTEEAPLRFMDQDVFHLISRLVSTKCRQGNQENAVPIYFQSFSLDY